MNHDSVALLAKGDTLNILVQGTYVHVHVVKWAPIMPKYQ